MEANSYESIRPVFHVGGWIVEPQANKLSSPSRAVLLEPKVMEVLACLALHAGEVVSQDHLMRAVWPDTFVTQDSLKRCVSVLRKALDDDFKHPEIIETIRKRGYRIVAPVHRDCMANFPANTNPHAESISIQGHQASLLSFFLAIGSLLGLDRREQRSGRVHSRV
jgi:DNA-binding winged helix-turn-helix (wHTH) protein